MKLGFVCALALTTLTAFGQSNQTSKNTLNEDLEILEEKIIKSVIENFLISIGNYKIDSLATMFTDNANISGASLKNGIWRSYTMTIQEFLATLRSSPNPEKYREPVNHWTIHIDGGRLAFVRADATLFKDGKAQSHNIDYFTLLKEDGQWKILNGSYVSQPMEPEKR